MQTLLIGKAHVNLTGSKVVSNKPITGHECGNVPSTQDYCDDLAVSIPPTSIPGARSSFLFHLEEEMLANTTRLFPLKVPIH